MKSVRKATAPITWTDFFNARLRDLEEQGLLRRLVPVEASVLPRAIVDGKEVILFNTNDYLGLASDVRLKRAAANAVEKWGTGSGGSRLISGNLSLYTELESECAKLKEAEAALVFSSGYSTNIGVICALTGPDDLILSDQLNHASIVDACRLSRSRVLIYPHCDIEAMESLIRANSPPGKILVVTDGVFSMDGDLAPLPDLIQVCHRYGALLMVDDAHGTGVLGPRGAGTLDHFGIEPDGVIQVGTFSKALGSLGGFVACKAVQARYLVNKARSLIYSTALPPAVLAASIEALRVVREDTGLRFKLRKLTQHMKMGLSSLGFTVPDQPTPIFPLIIGNSRETLHVSRYLFDRGIFTPAIRPPTVPRGQSRLRISLSAAHREEDIDRLIDTLSEFFRKGA